MTGSERWKRAAAGRPANLLGALREATAAREAADQRWHTELEWAIRDGLPQAQIGRAAGISRQRVHQLARKLGVNVDAGLD